MLIREFQDPVIRDSEIYRVRVHGRHRDDGMWAAWLEFDRGDGSSLITEEETSQPNLSALEYWAGGLEPVYLEGALERARTLVDR